MTALEHELYEALKNVLDVVGDSLILEECYPGILTQANRAIAKAEGQLK